MLVLEEWMWSEVEGSNRRQLEECRMAPEGEVDTAKESGSYRLEGGGKVSRSVVTHLRNPRSPGRRRKWKRREEDAESIATKKGR